jgi:hypothetical protein
MRILVLFLVLAASAETTILNTTIVSVDRAARTITIRADAAQTGDRGSVRTLTVARGAEASLARVKKGSSVLLTLRGDAVVDIKLSGGPVPARRGTAPGPQGGRVPQLPPGTRSPQDRGVPQLPPGSDPPQGRAIPQAGPATPSPGISPRSVTPRPAISPRPGPSPRDVPTPRPVVLPSDPPPTPIPSPMPSY